MVESTPTSQVINPAASAIACSPVRILAQVPLRCQRRNRPYTVCQGPYWGGTSRQGEPTRTRHRTPSISCRLLHFGGRPDFFPLGSNGSSTAHCASVKSARAVTAKVSTRSPVFRSFLVEEPSTGDLATYRSPTRPQAMSTDRTSETPPSAFDMFEHHLMPFEWLAGFRPAFANLRDRPLVRVGFQ